MLNSEECLTDVHLKSLSYRKQYLDNFMSCGSASGRVENRLTREVFGSEADGLNSLFKNNQSLLESLYPALGTHQDLDHGINPILRSADVGVVRLPLKEVSTLCQIGSDLSPEQPLFVLVRGLKADDGISTYLITVSQPDPAQDQGALQLDVKEISEELFEGVNNADVRKVLYCSKTRQLIVQTVQEISIYSLQVTVASLVAKHKSTLHASSEDTKVIKVEQGHVFIQDKDGITAYSVEEEPTSEGSKSELKKGALQKENEEVNLLMNSPVDPDTVTIQDIKRYEALMKGKAVSAISNAQTPRGLAENKVEGRPLYRRHNWIASGEEEFGPMEIKFDGASNLISLNVDLTFSCKDPNEQLKEEKRPQKDLVGQSSLVEDEGAKIDSKAQEPSRPNDVIKNLGQFTIKGVESQQILEESSRTSSGHQAQANKRRSKDESASFLPLIVHKHKGAQFNNSHQVNTIVLDNNQVFASNYARPEFYFRHLHGHIMTIDKFTIRSWLASRCGAYPVGRGLIFMAENLEALEMTRPFHKFTAEDYNQWKAKRMQDPRPLRPYEPVAFFEFDEGPSITIDIDFKKSCRYIMLKPTGFRSKPHHFRQSVNDLPMELEFFGVLGSSQPYDSSVDFCGSSDLVTSSKQNERPILSGHEIVINDLETDEELLRLDSLPISHLRVCNLPLDSQRALRAKGVSQMGHTTLRLTDQRISLRSLSGLSVRMNKVSSEGVWELRGVSMVGVVTQAGQIPPLYRSYLISPKYFSVVNKVLSTMIFDSKYDRALTSYIMQFLTKLIHEDYQFAGLILETIDLRRFITVNLLTNDQAHIQASVEFLRCF